MKFKNISRMSVVPFVWSADGECFLQPTYILKGETSLIQRHSASCWGYYYKGPFGRKVYYDFFSANPTEDFLRSLVEKSKEIFYDFWQPVVKMNNPELNRKDKIILDDEILEDKNIDYSFMYQLKRRNMSVGQRQIGEREKRNAVKCHICDENFIEGDTKVIDHNHFSGQYVGIAHKKCNWQRQTKPEMVVYFHNANYDFVQLLPK